MRLILILLLLLLPQAAHGQSPLPGLPGAQQTAPEPASADIDALITILENETARTQLIKRLKASAATEPALAPAEEAVPTFDLVQQFSAFTDSVARGFADLQQAGMVLWGEIQRGSAAGADMGAVAAALFDIAVVFVALYGSFFVLRFLVNALGNVLERRMAGRGLFLRLSASVLFLVIDAGSIVIAAIAGYFSTYLLGGVSGNLETTIRLLLAAFLLVELLKFCVRLFPQPRHPSIRWWPVSDEASAYWSFWINRLVGLVGYTVYFVSPVLASEVSPGVGRLAEIVVMAAVLVITIIVVLQNRQSVSAFLVQIADRRSQSGVAQLLRPLALYWHAIAISYLVALFVVWLTNPGETLPFMLAATGQTMLAVAIGVAIFAFIARVASVGLHLPADVKMRLPSLEARLSAFVPLIMGVVRWLVVAIVVLAIAQAWLIFDVVAWIGSEAGARAVGAVVSASVILLVCFVLFVAVSSWIEFRLSANSNKPPTAREKTLLGLFRNAFTIALVVFGLMLALAQIGVNIAPLLAGAGVIGLAIGFGAQKLVEDIITGIFIQFENVMNEGDVVEAAGRSGVVEKLTIRSVTIRDMSGTVHLIPFSSVAQVSNMARGFSFYVAEFEVARDSDIEAVKQAMRDAFDVVMAEPVHASVILDDLDLQGLIALTPTSVSLRARIKTLAGQQWGAGRFYSETVMRLFEERGIDTPTQRVSYVSESGGRLLPAT